MTTIVYDHDNQLIACDSRATAGGYITSDSVNKFITVNDEIWFFAGNLSDIDLFISEFEPNKEASEHLDCQAFVVSNKQGKMVWISEGVYKTEKLWVNDAFGSGGWHGQIAMDFGKTAKEAVEYAMTKDIHSGGKVHVYDIVKGKFI